LSLQKYEKKASGTNAASPPKKIEKKSFS